ncbi:MAG: MiaB/RimO family radical SAM methylthiotransferase [Spirochaeta sp.]|jgi:tRNA-2-methylthio-N6-dimethylallyladenosine synthase|nr:MiaB/RimO family radical SAM methylthiotransferase [Spirochaeta sp.]
MRYHLIPLGCQMNLSDTERIVTVLEKLGYEATEREEEADILGIVACSVRQKAIDRVYSKIHKWNEWKHGRNLLTFVSGCILPSDREKFLERFDLVFTINELPALPEMIRHYGVPTPAALTVVDAELTAPPAGDREPDARPVPAGAPMLTPAGPHGVTEDIRSGFWRVKPTYTSSFEAYVPIQNGCDKFCTFCAVPYTRGREVSRPSAEIINEVERLVKSGYRSITLLGQNVNSYGLDRRSDEIGFSQLLHEIGERTAGYPVWIYFTSPHPRDMTDEVLEAVAAHDTLANQIHLPIQSGDDKVLIRMNRNYRVSGYREVVTSIRKILPEATLFTDIIVGFSGETEPQFQKTLAAMEEFRYDMAFIAMYSPRPGAASARWADDIPQDEKKRRLRELTEVLQTTAGARNAAQVGRVVPVLVEGRDRQGYLSGRTEGRVPVRIEEPDDGNDVPPGSFLDVEITSARPLSLYGVPSGAPLLPTAADAPEQTVASVSR